MEEPMTSYKGYDVLNEQHHWDDHTREIVLERLRTPDQFRHLTGDEADRIRALAALFVSDRRPALLDYVVTHVDRTLGSDKGESQRPASVPPARQLIKDGLDALERLARTECGAPFTRLSPERQTALLVAIENGNAPLLTEDGRELPALPFFNKMLGETTDAYYSHPQIWSEIGYGGPAYPRGYVRTELGLTDPWEARRDA